MTIFLTKNKKQLKEFDNMKSLDELLQLLNKIDVSTLSHEELVHGYGPALLQTKKVIETLITKPSLAEQVAEDLLNHSIFLSQLESIPKVERLFEIGKEKQYTEQNPFVYNDAENYFFVGTVQNTNFFCMTTQSLGYIVIKREEQDYLVYRLYEDYHSLTSEKEKKYSLEEMIDSANFYRGFSDVVEGNTYIKRPNFSFFKEHLEKEEKLPNSVRRLLTLSDSKSIHSKEIYEFQPIQDFFDILDDFYITLT